MILLIEYICLTCLTAALVFEELYQFFASAFESEQLKKLLGYLNIFFFRIFLFIFLEIDSGFPSMTYSKLLLEADFYWSRDWRQSRVISDMSF